MKDDDVRLHRLEVEARRSRWRERLGDAARVGMIVGEPRRGGASIACSPAAAKMPACRIAPPSMRRCRTPRRSSARDAGQQRAARRAEPLRERHRDEVERRGQLGSAQAGRDVAFQSRAPSRKVAMPRSRAASQMRTTSSCGKTMPPPRLCVFSISTSVVGG